MGNNLRLIFYNTYAFLKMEVDRFYLGFLWWVIEPIFYMTAFYFIFAIVLKRGGGPDFVVFLLCGIGPYRWFDGAVQSGANSLLTNSRLMQQVYVPKFIFPSVSVLTATTKFLIILTILLIFLIVYGIPVTLFWRCLPFVLFVQFLFIISVTWIIAAIIPLLPDLSTVIRYSILMMFFLSGVFYDINEAPERVAVYFKINPMALIIDNYRRILLNANWPNWHQLAAIALGSVILWKIAHIVLKKFDRKYPKLSI